MMSVMTKLSIVIKDLIYVEGVNHMAEKWVSVSEACQLLQVSERTLYRKIKDGKLETRMTDDSHREVLLTVPMTKEEIAEGHLKLASETVDSQLKIVATALGSTELVNKRMQAELDFVKTELDRVRDNARSELVRVQEHSHQQIEYIKTEVVRSRRLGIIGWGVSGLLVLILLIVSIVTVNKLSKKETMIEVASANADSAKKMSNVLTDRLTDKEREIRRLAADVATVKGELTDNKAKLAALSIEKARLAIIVNQRLTTTRATDITMTRFATTLPVTSRPTMVPGTTLPSTLPVTQPISSDD
jgi:excisionase family DNA binding protein